MTTCSPTILTASGHYFDYTAPESATIRIESIAHALSNLCRFLGHTNEFYSVAQHSVFVSHLVPPEHALAGLLHDAAEAFVGDVVRPLKTLLPEYKALEKRIEGTVLSTFGLLGIPHCVKHADLVMLATERRDLMPDHEGEWETLTGIEPLSELIVPLPPKEAKNAFLQRFDQITRRAV